MRKDDQDTDGSLSPCIACVMCGYRLYLFPELPEEKKIPHPKGKNIAGFNRNNYNRVLSIKTKKNY